MLILYSFPNMDYSFLERLFATAPGEFGSGPSLACHYVRASGDSKSNREGQHVASGGKLPVQIVVLPQTALGTLDKSHNLSQNQFFPTVK